MRRVPRLRGMIGDNETTRGGQRRETVDCGLQAPADTRRLCERTNRENRQRRSGKRRQVPTIEIHYGYPPQPHSIATREACRALLFSYKAPDLVILCPFPSLFRRGSLCRPNSSGRRKGQVLGGAR